MSSRILGLLQCWFLLASTGASAQHLYVGGVDGLESLANPSSSRQLRSGDGLSLYVHDSSWRGASEKLRFEIINLFKRNPVAFEGNESGSAEAYWTRVMNEFSGKSPETAHIDCETPTRCNTTIFQWKEFVSEGRKRGIKIVSPIITPNEGSWKTSSFADNKWDDVRDRAQIGGGITLDAPPWYYNTHPQGYKDFVTQEIKWATGIKINVSLIISPPRTNDGSFLAETKTMMNDLKERNVEINTLIVENYMSLPPENYRFVIGSESDPESILGVSLWLKKHFTK